MKGCRRTEAWRYRLGSSSILAAEDSPAPDGNHCRKRRGDVQTSAEPIPLGSHEWRAASAGPASRGRAAEDWQQLRLSLVVKSLVDGDLLLEARRAGAMPIPETVPRARQRMRRSGRAL